MKYFLKREWKWLVAVLTIFIITLGLLLIKTKYEVVTPAVISPVDQYITIGESKKDDISINTTSVYGFYNANLLNFLISKVNPFSDEEKIYSYQDTSTTYTTKQGTLHRDFSIRNSIVSGYKKAGYNVDVIFKGYTVTSIYDFGISMNFELGDTVKKVDDLELSEELSLDKALKKIREIDSSKIKFNCLIERDQEEKEVELELYVVEDKKYLPIVTEVDYTFRILDENAPKYDYEYGDALGPSGGLMQSLYIYEKLTGCKLTKGLKIAGTGTIDINGNAGLIGGIKQKIYTANANKVDIFFVPVDNSRETEDDKLKNWKDAEIAYKKLLFTKMEIVPVSSLDDIIKYLEERQ